MNIGVFRSATNSPRPPLRNGRSHRLACIDEIDAMLQRSPDHGSGFRVAGPVLHPATDGPGSDGDTRHFGLRAGNGESFHVERGLPGL